MKVNEKKEIIPRHGESANGQRILKAAREKKQAIYKTHTHKETTSLTANQPTQHGSNNNGTKRQLIDTGKTTQNCTAR